MASGIHSINDHAGHLADAAIRIRFNHPSHIVHAARSISIIELA